jgi:hypothetical protein
MPFEDRLRLIRLVDTALAVSCRELGFLPEASARSPTEYGENWFDGDFGAYLYVTPNVLALFERRLQRPLIDNSDLLPLFRAAWDPLVLVHARLLYLLLGPESDALDEGLGVRGLSSTGLDLKSAGFNAALDEYLEATTWLQRRKWFRGLLRWADVVIGSLSSIPVVGGVLEPIKEWKESIEAQLDTEAGRRATKGRRSRRTR